MNNGSILSQSTQQVGLGLRESQPGETQPEQGHPAPVAPKELLASSDETNPHVYSEWLFMLSSYYGANVGEGSVKKVEEYFKKRQKVSPRHIAVACYIRLNTVTISSMITSDLGIPEGSTCRIVKNLKEWGVIKHAGTLGHRLKRGIKGGPQPEILKWAQVDRVPPELIANLNQRYYKNQNPALGEISRIIPMLISDYVRTNEINYRDIVQVVKKKLPGYQVSSLAEEIALNLHHEGIKVWRRE